MAKWSGSAANVDVRLTSDRSGKGHSGPRRCDWCRACRDKYQKEVAPALKERFHYKNIMEIPRLEKVVLNMGVGEATGDAKAIDAAVADMTAIVGQKPVVTRAKKSIAAFKLRAGMPIGVKVTLRGERMYEFLDKLFNACLASYS